MKVFVGIQLEDEMKTQLSTIQSRLQNVAEKGNFTQPSNFHLTLRFIGEVEETKRKKIEAALATIDFQPFEIQTSQLGFFTKKRGLIPWVGIAENKALYYLYEKVNDAITGIVPADTKPYTAHITLGRNVRIDSKELQRTIPTMTQTVTAIHLFLSHRMNHILIYTPIFTVYSQQK